MSNQPNTLEDILFEIARTMDYVRHDPSFPEAQSYKVGATGYIAAKVTGRGLQMEVLEWQGGKMPVRGGDWFEIPSLLLQLCKLVAKDRPVKSIFGQFSPQDVLTLQAKGTHGVLGEWSLAYLPKTQIESPERLRQADDVRGIPDCVVSALRELNERLRTRLFPLRPKSDIPVKFWNIADPALLCTALQYLYPQILARFDYDDAAVPPLPAGYTTVCTIFNMFEEIDNEGFRTAIDNLGPDYRDPLVAELGRVGLPVLGDLFYRAWQAHPEGAEPDAKAFKTLTSRLGSLIDDDEATMHAIHRYVSANAHLFEQAD